MTALTFQRRNSRHRLGLKGPRAAEWLAGLGIVVPAAPNTWAVSGQTTVLDDALLTARLGTGEFFLEDRVEGTTLRGIEPAAETHPPGVYPVSREDAAFLLLGDGSTEVLAQVCNVNFADLQLDSQPVIMTLMIGVSVLVIPQNAGGERRYRIWCDPTFAPYLEGSLETVVNECGGGGSYRGVKE
jgi:sarcosine oxidase subunit gamma